MRRALAGLATAALAASAPARAYERTVSETTGAPLFWPLPVVPYGMNASRPFSSESCAAGPAGDPALDAVRAGYSAWRRPCAGLDLVYAGTTDEIGTGFEGFGENVVVFRQGWCSNDPQASVDPCYDDPDVDCGNIYGCFEDHSACPPGVVCADRNVVALTSVLYDPGNGRIFDADIQVNGWDGAPGALAKPPSHGWYFTCDRQAGWPPCAAYGQPDCYYMDLQNTITHEAGHVLGLAHTGDSSTTMYGGTDVGETTKRVLSPDDVAGVCAIYPTPTGCASTGGGAGALQILLAAAALRRQRSPRTQRPGACPR